VAIVGEEKDPLALDRVFESAGAFRDERLAQAIAARISRGDLPPRTTGMALRALGRQRGRARLDLLKAFAGQRDEHKGVVQDSALHSLGLSHDTEAFRWLLSQAAVGKVPFRARRGMVSGIAASVPYQEKPARTAGEDALVDLLRDPEPLVRLQAARGLVSARVRSAVPALEAYRRGVPLQEQVGVDAGIASLSKGDDDKVGALEKQLEEMKAKWRKLDERLDALEGERK